MASELQREIIQHLGVLSADGRFSKEVNIVSWNGAEPVLDVRIWDKETGRAHKGVTIKPKEAVKLIDILDRWIADAAFEARIEEGEFDAERLQSIIEFHKASRARV